MRGKQGEDLKLIEFGTSHFDDFLAEGSTEELIEFIRAAYAGIRLAKTEKALRAAGVVGRD